MTALALLIAVGVPATPVAALTPVDCPPFSREALETPLALPPAGDDPELVMADPTGLQLSRPDGSRGVAAYAALAKSVKYTLTTWLPRCYGDQEGTPYLDPRGNFERTIRPMAMAAYGLAVALQTNAYDSADVGGVSREDALVAAKRLVLGVVAFHQANNPGDFSWGHGWQSSLWSYYAGYAGWLLRDELTPEERRAVSRMVADEAAYRVAEYRRAGVPYMYSASGQLLRRGDSQAEENAWNSMALSLAATMLRGSSKVAENHAVAARYQMGSYIRKSDLSRKTLFDGARIGSAIKGYNLESNGVMINHNRVHPEYMSLITLKTSEALNTALINQSAGQSALYNVVFEYRAMTSTRLSNGIPAYRPNSWRINYPSGNDWGTGRITNYALLDLLAVQFTRGKVRRQADAYYDRHMGRQIALMGRFSDGRTYAGSWADTNSEYRYVGREQITAADLAQIWLTVYFGRHDRFHQGATDYLK